MSASQRQQCDIEAELLSLIEGHQIDVPMLPEVANKALLLAQDTGSDASEMAKLIQSDQALAAHVMRIANSAAYCPLANLVSLQQAVARLGMAVLSEIALSASLGAKLFTTPGYESHTEQHWQHALATGLWAKEIARQTRSNVEVAFLAGLLHSIGFPAVLQALLDLSKEHNQILEEQQTLTLVNKHTHQASMFIMKEWQMPELVIRAVSDYQSTEQATISVSSAQIQAARSFADFQLGKVSKDTLLNLPAYSHLNLYQDDVETLLARHDSVTEKLQELSA